MRIRFAIVTAAVLVSSVALAKRMDPTMRALSLVTDSGLPTIWITILTDAWK